MITYLRRLCALLAVVAGALVLLHAGPAAADTANPDGPVGNTLTLSAAAVNILLGAVLPFLVGVLVKPNNPQWVKVGLGLAAAAAAAVIANAVRDDGTAVLSWAMFLQFATVYLGQLGAYLGILAPIGQDTAAGSFNRALGPGVVPIERRRPAAAGTG